jgi:tetratricopeptide (TPR) repeat protein
MRQDLPDFELTFFEGLIEKDPNYVEALASLAELYTRKGLYEKGLEIDKRLVKLKKDDAIVYYNLACSYALLMQLEDAAQSLERAIELGYKDFDYMKKDRDLKNLHKDNRFLHLMSEGKGKPGHD